MNSQKRGAGHHGSGAIEWLFVGVVLAVLAGAGVVAYQHTWVSSAGTSGTAPSRSQQPETADRYAGWKTYTSRLGGFSLRYPNGWGLSGFQGNTPVAADHMTGQETTIRLQSTPDTKVDDFGIVMYVSTGTSHTPYDTYGNGTTTVLPNGITLWQEKEQETYAAGPATDSCPVVQVGTDDTFSLPLPTGDYLSVYGSFCWGQGQTTGKTYAQQVGSPEWAAAIDVVKSIQY